MTDEHQTIAHDLLHQALDATDEPARAVSVLLSAAVTILERSFGREAAIELATGALDRAGAEVRRVAAH